MTNPISAQCAGKVTFQSPDTARRAAKRKKRRHAYRCPHCGLYHVGTDTKTSLAARNPRKERRWTEGC